MCETDMTNIEGCFGYAKHCQEKSENIFHQMQKPALKRVLSGK